jgi:hypothetical protein
LPWLAGVPAQLRRRDARSSSVRLRAVRGMRSHSEVARPQRPAALAIGSGFEVGARLARATGPSGGGAHWRAGCRVGAGRGPGGLRSTPSGRRGSAHLRLARRQLARRAAPTGAKGCAPFGCQESAARLGAVLACGRPSAARGMQLGAGVAQFRGRRAAGAAARSGVRSIARRGRSPSARDSG